MTLKTVTGPSTRDALAQARRLFGNDVVLLQSAPAAHGQPASVTVAFDAVPSPDHDLTASLQPESWTVEPVHPEPARQPAPRAYGYANVRKAAPTPAEPISAYPPAREIQGDGAHRASALAIPTAPTPTARPYSNTPSPHASGLRADDAPSVASSAVPVAEAPEPTASASEVAALRARLAELEAVIAEVRAQAPPPVLRRTPLVFVGPGGSGKTSLALRLAQSPALTKAQRPAVLIVAPEAERFVDPAPVFWGVGVPVTVAHTPEDVTEALETLADADLLLVDTPSLPLSAERARPLVRRLGEMLAPLGTVEVHFVLDATRSRTTVTPDTLRSLGLTPDALALARLDEAPVDAAGWAAHLELAVRFWSSGPDLEDLSDAPLASPTPAPAFAVEPVASRVRTLTDPFEVAPEAAPPAFTHVPVLA